MGNWEATDSNLGGYSPRENTGLIFPHRLVCTMLCANFDKDIFFIHKESLSGHIESKATFFEGCVVTSILRKAKLV